MSDLAALGLLRALCSGLAPGGIEVVADAQCTAFVPDRRRILVARRFLSAETPVAIGALLHEVGHALVTRYHLFAAPDEVPPALWRTALNAVEEARVHCFLRRRLPGAGVYLDALFAMDDPPGEGEFDSELVAFLAAVAIWDRYPSLPFLEGVPAAAAFHRTEPARLRYRRTLPPPELMPLANLQQRYESLVLSVLATADADRVVPLEAEIRCAAASALNTFRAEIWPEVMALAARDQARIAWALVDDPALSAIAADGGSASSAERPALARRALRRWRQRHATQSVPEVPLDDCVGKLAWELLREYLRAVLPPHEWRSLPERYARTRRSSRPEIGERAADGDRATTEQPAPTAWDEETQAAHRALVDVLRRVTPRRPTQWSSGHRSGTHIDIERVMRIAAAGQHSEHIWLRRSVERPELAALLLVDLSGSMAGQKVKAAMAATRALSAALAELRGIAWCVLGFQDKTIPFVDFEERAPPRVMARIDGMVAEVAGNRASGNNQPRYNDDGPCLLEAAARLQARRERHRLLMVMSDGSPAGRQSGRDELHRAVARVQAMPGMTLVGLGLGPSTEHVTDYYPVSQANIALGDLAPAVGRLLASGLRAAVV